MLIHKIEIVSCMLLSLNVWLVTADLKKFADANRLVAANIYKEISKIDTEDSFVVSPFSVETILALTLSGANGTTFDEIQEALNLGNDTKAIEDTFKTLIKSVLSTNNIKLATKIYVSKSKLVKDEFKSVAVNNYLSSLEYTDFEATENVNEAINNWGKLELQKALLNSFNDTNIDQDSAIVLVNAIRFKANWSDKVHIINSTFRSYGKNITQVQTFVIGGVNNFYEDPELDAKILEIAFEGNETSIVIVLPNKYDGLKKLEEKVEKVFTANKPSSPQQVMFNLPSFIIANDLHLRKVLKSLGVESAFDIGSADFSNIVEEDQAYINEIIHGAVVDLSPHETEASAVSLVPDSVKGRSGVHFFIADHPFLFYIKAKDVILFTGRVVTPGTNEVPHI